MMSLNSNKRKTRMVPNNSKPGRPKVMQEKNMALEGIYGNSRFMHAAASLVGCVIQVKSKTGKLHEGVFRTFSPQMDIVLEMAHLVDDKHVDSATAGSNGLLPFLTADTVIEKLIFSLTDIVAVSAINTDLDYAAKDNSTDTVVNKMNGQVTEKELEPWDGPIDSVDGLGALEAGDTNGWNADDMFRTNAEKYGVKTSYDNNLPGYTVKLEQKNTDEYKRQEAKASRIAQEIQSSPAHKVRDSTENGDEEDRLGTFLRPENSIISNNRHLPPARRKNVHTAKVTCNNGPPGLPLVAHASSVKSRTSTQSQHTAPSSPFTTSQSHSKSSSSASTPSSMSSPSPAQSPESTAPKPLVAHTSPQNKPVVHSPVMKDHKEMKTNGELEKEQKTSNINPRVSPVTIKEPTNVSNTTVPLQPSPSSVPASKIPEKKSPAQKCRDDKTEEELKKFHAAFKLCEEGQHPQQQKQAVVDTKTNNETPSKTINEDKQKEEAEKIKDHSDAEKVPSTTKSSTLNPDAEAFTPRSMRVAVPLTPPLMQPPRLQVQSQVLPIHHQMMAGLAQPIFATLTPQYIMSATPVSVSLSSPFHAAPIVQGPRFRKVHPSAVPVALQQRQDLTPSAHVAAATGPPILATAAIPAPQLAVQYAHSPGLIQTAGHQTSMGYPQAYSMVGPRVLSPQPVGIMPTPQSCGDNHLPAQLYSEYLYMSPHPGAAAISTAVPTQGVPLNAVSQGTSGQRSNASTPHSHAPSPVQQPPPNASHVTPAHTPTPTGHPGSAHTPQPVVYHGPLTSQHALQPGPHGPNPGHSQGHHVASLAQHHAHINQHNYGVPPQQLLLMSQQAVSASHPAFHGHPNHNQTPSSHAHLLPHTVIPTNATMVHTSANTLYVQHHQGV